MLVSFAELLYTFQERGSAGGAFTCYTFESAFAAIEAARQHQSGVILLISEKSLVSPQGSALIAGLRAIATLTAVPVCLQLDHVSDLARIERACQMGFGSVMADGSRLSFAENCAFVRQAVALGQQYGVQIEAELGRVEGNEDIAQAAAAGALTDPEQADLFCEQTACACLAVSIGNVHGLYRHPPRLDWERLRQLRQRLSIPLSLHGASGLPEADLRQAIALGINKINVNTELRASYFATLESNLQDLTSGLRLLELQQMLIEGQKRVIQSKMAIYTLSDNSLVDKEV